jgi:hypothetical protein
MNPLALPWSLALVQSRHSGSYIVITNSRGEDVAMLNGPGANATAQAIVVAMNATRPFEFTGTCAKCGELVSDGRAVHAACEDAHVR